MKPQTLSCKYFLNPKMGEDQVAMHNGRRLHVKVPKGFADAEQDHTP